MDLMTLDSNYQPSKLVENYDSLIWTERFNTMGDFQITTGDISRFMSLLPEGQPICIRESPVPMLVETHKIERKKNTAAKLTITGRAFESIYDRRPAIQYVQGGTGDWSVVAKLPSDIAYYIMKYITVDGALSVDDIFPGVTLQAPPDYLTSSGPNKSFSVPRGGLLTAVLGFLQTAAKADPTTSPPTPVVIPKGIRSVRPSISGNHVTIQFYTGVDRSNTVYFDATRDLLDDGNYLFSKIGSADSAYVIGPSTGLILNKAGGSSGFDRRVVLVDGTSSGVGDQNSLVEAGKTVLTEAAQTAAFDGSINQDLNPYVYGIDYFLGDMVKLVGDYGLSSSARVVEYIRAEDSTGIKSYPTLQTV